MTPKTPFTFSFKKHHIFTHCKIGIVVAEWNAEITDKLLEGALLKLTEMGVNSRNIHTYKIPGSFELPLAAQWLAQKEFIEAVLVLGCLIKGETPHFEYIAEAVSQGIKEVNLKYNKPVIFGVLTTLTLEQALERVGGIHGHKGEEAAATALQMLVQKYKIEALK